MTGPTRTGADVTDILRRYFRDRAPGSPPVALQLRVEAIPDQIERTRGGSARSVIRGVAGLAAAAAIAVLLVRAVPFLPPFASGSAAGTPAPVAFDPTITGPGIDGPFIPGLAWLVTALAVLGLAITAIATSGRRRIIPAAAGAAVLGYALYGALVPIDLSVTGYGAGLNMSEVQLPLGTNGQLYYVTAKPSQPFSFGIDLTAALGSSFRVESVATPIPLDQYWVGMRFTAVWLDGSPNGGMIGPSQLFRPFDYPPSGRSIWLVGLAGKCAIGREPATGDATVMGVESIDSIQINVSVLGWPRVIDVPIPTIAQGDDAACENALVGPPSVVPSP